MLFIKMNGILIGKVENLARKGYFCSLFIVSV